MRNVNETGRTLEPDKEADCDAAVLTRNQAPVAARSPTRHVFRVRRQRAGLPSIICRSWIVSAAPGALTERPPSLQVHGVLDEPDGAIGHADVHAAGMVARQGDNALPTPSPTLGEAEMPVVSARQEIGRAEVKK